MVEKSVYVLLVNPHEEYLLLKAADGKEEWSLPGGHPEGSENDIQALSRELFEECKIKDFQLAKNFVEEDRFINQKGIERLQIIYLARTKNTNVILSNEHTKFGWFKFGEVITKMRHDSWKGILRRADKILRSSSSK